MISLLYALFKLLLIFRDQESYDDITKNISISRDITKIPPIISTQKHMIHELWQSKKNVFFCDSISSQFPLLQNMQSNMPLFWAATHFPGNKETVHFWKQRQRQATVNTGNGQGRTVKTSLEGKKISSLVESFESTNFINIWNYSNYF